jgi:hypothetical protein
MTSSATVKVRIAVVVDPTGDWCAGGWKDCKGWQEAIDELSWDFEDAHGEARYWVTIELPVPPPTVEPIEVEATVVEKVT